MKQAPVLAREQYGPGVVEWVRRDVQACLRRATPEDLQALLERLGHYE